jgi:hypothetical protein
VTHTVPLREIAPWETLLQAAANSQAKIRVTNNQIETF